jgi:hypothetical protein
MVVNFSVKQLSCGNMKSHFEASLKKAQNGPSTQLIKATSCIERSNATIKAKALLTFYLSNANNGKKLVKLLITKEACRKFGAHECQ